MSQKRFDAGVYANRLHAAAAAAADAGLAGLVITPGYDLRYLIGSRAETFERLTALVIPISGEPTVVVPRLELASLRESAAVELALPVRDWVDGEDPYDLVLAALGGAPVATAVTDAMPALHLLPLTAKLGVLPVLATDVLRTLRMIKDPAEIDALRKAGAAIDRVHARVPEFLVPGRTEADVAADIAQSHCGRRAFGGRVHHRRLRTARRGPASRGIRPRTAGRRHRRRRHRRPVRAGLQLRLDPHLQPRRARVPKSPNSIRYCSGRSRRPSSGAARGDRRAGRRRGPRRAGRGRPRRVLRAPHRARNRAVGARGALHRRR